MQKYAKDEQYLSIKEAKEYTTMSYNALKKAVKLGHLQSTFVNGRYVPLFLFRIEIRWHIGTKFLVLGIIF